MKTWIGSRSSRTRRRRNEWKKSLVKDHLEKQVHLPLTQWTSWRSKKRQKLKTLQLRPQT